MKGRPVLWDVDTQVDFMLPEGKLYVPGAEETRGAMERLVQGARAAGIVHVASADDHELTDPEISDDPDFETTYPPHCLRGTRGALKIPETEQVEPLPLGATPYPPALLRELVGGRREILLLKKSYSVFANPSADPLVEILDPAEIVVFGVATDVCDDAAIMGLLDRGRTVAFVEDAARGLSEERVASCTVVWRERGVRFTTTDDVLAGW
jgi:nicotinamidase/pyrazinamidase